MSKFETMPLRFRVWDNKNKEMYSNYSMDEASKLVRFIGRKNAIISQDTGLKDKNGESIYTGDILKIPHADGYNNVEVIFHMGSSYVYAPSLFPNTPYLLLVTTYNDSEVVGNIWQNPELLEEE